MGSNGADAMFLQCLLNKSGAMPRLTEDGAFGPRTRAAVVAYQQAHRPLAPDGTVGPRTWATFGTLTERQHPVRLVGQPNNVTCWSAAATMILGNMSVGQGGATVEPGGGLSMPLQNIETFLSGLGWRLINNQSRPSIGILIQALNRGPLWVAYEGGTFQHAVVYSGYYTDAAGDESATVFQVYDPWPPGRGTVYGTTYHGGVAWDRAVSPPKAAMIQYVASAR